MYRGPPPNGGGGLRPSLLHHPTIGAPGTATQGLLAAPPPLMGQAPAHLGLGAPIRAPQTSVFQQTSLFSGAPLNTGAKPLFATPPVSQQSWAPPPSLAFSVPPPGGLTTPGSLPPPSAPIYPSSFNQQPLGPAYFPPAPQYLSYTAQYPAFTPAAPSMGAAPFSLPPPNLPCRDRSPLRRERNRERVDRYSRDEGRDRERDRDRERRSSRLSREERRGDKRRPDEWEERDNRDRDRIRRSKDRRENIPAAFSRSGSSPRRPTQDQGGSLVPYEDDSEGEGGEEGRRSRMREEDMRRREGSRRREERESSSRRDDREESSRRDWREGSGRRDGRGGSSKRDSREGSSRRENSSKREERDGGGKRKNSESRQSSPSKEEELKQISPEQVIEQEKKVWIRSAPADLYYTRDPETPGLMRATEKNIKMQEKATKVLVESSKEARLKHPVEEPPRLRLGHHHGHEGEEGEGSSSEEDEEENPHNHRVESLDWLEFRSKAPNRAHPEVGNIIPSLMCSKKARESGIRHGIYVGETPLPDLDMRSNNWSKLYHYRVTISPPTNFLIKNPTIIHHDEHEFIFEGFSMFTVDKIPDLPVCKVVRFNIEYNILYFEEKMPENFTLGELDLFHQYFFYELLELWDWSVDGRFYFMPRFVRDLSENGKEILSMNEVVSYMLRSYAPLNDEQVLADMAEMPAQDWQRVAERSKGMLVTFPGNKPSTLRVDQLDREHDQGAARLTFPDIVHFGIRPPQLSYAGSQEYQKAWREFVKFRHLLANMAKPTFKDRRELEAKEHALQEMRSNSKLKRDCTAVVSSEGYHKTGLMTDIVQHAMLLPVLVNHLRLNNSLDHLEKRINYKFKNRSLLQQAVTHPSYKENFGTNPDHIRNTLSNCGIRQPQYGDKKIHYQNTRKRGINMLINIMSRFGKKIETESKVQHNERLEFLGDAVVEFITSVHLFYMFPDLEEGGLATYRAAIVQNQHLAVLAGGLGLEKYMLYAHGSDLCHDSELKHAMANCFEALMGAIFLDGGIDITDRVFSDAMFGSDSDLFDTWVDLPKHPLQTQEPEGDRHWISKFPVLQKLTEFEEMTGIEFTHVRLLARSFTDRSIGFNNLTLGSNQRMEFLGDTVLQLITSDFLYKHFPDHHEGHLSLLRSSLVNNRTQSVVCDDLGMTRFAVYANPKAEIKVKDKADLLEAFLGALYVDKDLEWCTVFAHVCFFPRLQQFILNQDWNDPKSKLQQCCLTLRTMDGGEPDIPVYKVIECKGPTNTRVYTVAVYFRGERLAKDYGHSIQQAEMNAAKIALEKCAHLFPHLNYQKRIMERSFKRQGVGDLIRDNWYQETLKKRAELGMDDVKKEEPENVAEEKSRDTNMEEQSEEVVEVKGDLEISAAQSRGEKSKPDNKHAVMKEIKDIEDKLARRKQRKEGAEDGECVDSEEETVESVAEKTRVENKKRWGKEGKTAETQSSSPPATSTSNGAGCSKEIGQSEMKGKKDEEKIEKERDKVKGGQEERVRGEPNNEKDGKRKRESSSRRSKGERRLGGQHERRAETNERDGRRGAGRERHRGPGRDPYSPGRQAHSHGRELYRDTGFPMGEPYNSGRPPYREDSDRRGAGLGPPPYHDRRPPGSGYPRDPMHGEWGPPPIGGDWPPGPGYSNEGRGRPMQGPGGSWNPPPGWRAPPGPSSHPPPELLGGAQLGPHRNEEGRGYYRDNMPRR